MILVFWGEYLKRINEKPLQTARQSINSNLSLARPMRR